ncbi:bifunctional folylpolyglutamate synthase/dihydrofolate synthase [Neobacillus sp. SM06]|uniref:bifunctional folylpolyglutamate synthase/dihydrofolate synthase n=1 Tax=Neobacillus sp. SM06 TaxID=3422492 RepID=UPI003D2D114B
MVTTYQEALDWIHARLKLGIKPGLKRMEWMMEKLGNSEKSLKTVHIGGTNGKGSTVTFLRSILQAGGYTVGTFTSPYIEQFNERISLNGKPISDEEIVKLTNVILPLADELEKTELGGPTEFEVITAMSLYYFANVHPVDIVIYEVGLGGRLDSTNVIKPLLSIITNIGLDHTAILGNSYSEIAFEKAGIIKKGTPVFSAVQQPDAINVITEKAREMTAPLSLLNRDFSICSHSALEHGEKFSLETSVRIWGDLEIGMMGSHQTENASLAVMAADYLSRFASFPLVEAEMRTGLKTAYWPGRFEVVSTNPLVIVDGAHNDEGIKALVEVLTSRFQNRKIHLIFTALKDKKLDQMIASLDQVAEEIVFVSFEFPRASTAAELYDLSCSPNKAANEDWQSAVVQQIGKIGNNDVLVITGSLYFISIVKPFLRDLLQK